MNKENNKPPFIGDILKVNFNIPEAILDKYYSLVPQPKTVSEIPSPARSHYVGKLHRYFSPFSVNIDGAYPVLTDWQMLEYKIDNAEYPEYKSDKVWPALHEFAKGFHVGYDTFIEEKILKNSLSKNEVYIAQKIMDYLSSPYQKIGGFSETRGTDVNIFDGWFNDGINAGYFYHAWIYIFENHRLFEQYFEKAKQKPEAKALPDLAAIFADKNDLVKLVNELKKRGFVNDTGKWIGVESKNASGEGYQLVTLSEVCKPYYNKPYAQSKLHVAWTKYFNSDIEYNNFKPAVIREFMTDSYKRLFNFVSQTI